MGGGVHCVQLQQRTVEGEEEKEERRKGTVVVGLENNKCDIHLYSLLKRSSHWRVSLREKQ